MDRTQIFVLGILVIMAIIINKIMYAKQTIYFFISEDDESVNKLKELLSNPNNEIILVNYKQNINLEKLNSLINQCSNRSLIKDILNIEGMEDLQGVLIDSCYKNAKCVNQPSNKFYEIYNTIGVFGYPFKFKDSASELLDNKTNNLIDVRKDKTCSRRYSVDTDSPPWQRRRSLDY